MKNSPSPLRLAHPVRSLPLFVLVGVSLLVALAVPPAAHSDDSHKKTISVETSSGSFRAEVDSRPAHLRLPLYPGAKLMKADGTGSLDVSLQLSGKPTTRLAVAKYITGDPLEKVRDFYKEKLGSGVTKFTPKTDDGGVSFELKGKGETRAVGLKSTGGGTEIDMVRVEGMQDDESKP